MKLRAFQIFLLLLFSTPSYAAVKFVGAQPVEYEREAVERVALCIKKYRKRIEKEFGVRLAKSVRIHLLRSPRSKVKWSWFKSVRRLWVFDGFRNGAARWEDFRFGYHCYGIPTIYGYRAHWIEWDKPDDKNAYTGYCCYWLVRPRLILATYKKKVNEDTFLALVLHEWLHTTGLGHGETFSKIELWLFERIIEDMCEEAA